MIREIIRIIMIAPIDIAVYSVLLKSVRGNTTIIIYQAFPCISTFHTKNWDFLCETLENLGRSKCWEGLV